MQSQPNSNYNFYLRVLASNICEVTIKSKYTNKTYIHKITYTGQPTTSNEYINCWDVETSKPFMLRLDEISCIKILDEISPVGVLPGLTSRPVETNQSAKAEQQGITPTLQDVTTSVLSEEVKNEYKTSLRRGPCEVVFIKSDGTTRKMIATLDSKTIIDHASLSSSVRKHHTDPDLITVVDTEIMEWRSFRFSKLISFRELARRTTLTPL